jgi:GTP-binding protein HflX
LAHLQYQRGRLVRSWTHLERQRGGGGFMGGPGETQIESDRRQLQDRIQRLKKDLEQVRRTRRLQRAGRQKVPYPVVALVGYTNAGKSTLFNYLTNAQVMAKDMLFATLDPTLRAITLPHGMTAVLSDTVGFITDLPTQLVAAFRATLEEVIEADVILHVRDIAHPDTDAQKADVEKVLKNLGWSPGGTGQAPMIEICNKADLLPEDQQARLIAHPNQGRLLVSAITGQGVPELLNIIERDLASSHETVHLHLPLDQAGELHWFYSHGEVFERQENDDGSIELSARFSPRNLSTLQSKYGALIQL